MTVALDGSLADVPLSVHARYQREEILAALGLPDACPTVVPRGCLVLPDSTSTASSSRLRKSEADYSPTTMYRDYPITPDTVPLGVAVDDRVDSPTGQRYLEGSSTVLLFVRYEQKDEFGTSPYLFLGPAHYVATPRRPADRDHLATGDTRCRPTSSTSPRASRSDVPRTSLRFAHEDRRRGHRQPMGYVPPRSRRISPRRTSGSRLLTASRPWRPASRFLFKTKDPKKFRGVDIPGYALVGGGFFDEYVELRVSEAWTIWGVANGVLDEAELASPCTFLPLRGGGR